MWWDIRISVHSEFTAMSVIERILKIGQELTDCRHLFGVFILEFRTQSVNAEMPKNYWRWAVFVGAF